MFPVICRVSIMYVGYLPFGTKLCNAQGTTHANFPCQVGVPWKHFHYTVAHFWWVMAHFRYVENVFSLFAAHWVLSATIEEVGLRVTGQSQTEYCICNSSGANN